MERYMERVFKVIREDAERPVFVDGTESVTYGDAKKESGKIYHYLKTRGIGKEDCVQIIMKKDVHFFSCMLGVWRAGAALVINEDNYPKERLEYIGKDINAKCVLDRALFKTIMEEEEELEGYEETDLHDACFAVYTSGSTGNPKGVLHEYGNLDLSMASFFPKAEEYIHYRNGFVPPLNFVATIMGVAVTTGCAMTNYIVSGDLLRNFNELKKFIEDNELDRMYLPPSYIRLYKNPAKCLKTIQTGSEPANGLYYEGGYPEIVNTYSMSEAGFCVLATVLDKAYDTAPVGFPSLDIEYQLIDDDGKIVEGPGQGELCFRNKFVRGYINLPEQTKKAFVDGMYHTADICRRDENGAYYVVGRNDDMIKINGNRIEPAEIEAAVQRCAGLEKVIAKGFSNERRAFIAVYYLKDDAEKCGFDEEHTAEAIKKTLPSYMLPTYYIPLKAFPLNPNGKISKKDLPAPEEKEVKTVYVAPENDNEKYFCEKMREVLDLDRVGAEDDFYLIGGDSISAIKLVEACTDYEISVKQIYELKTPRNLAFNCEKQTEDASKESLIVEGKLDIMPTMRQFLYYHSYAPESAFLNMPKFWKLKDDVDLSRLKRAVLRLLKYHPEVCAKLTEGEDGGFYQEYESSFLEEDPVDEIVSPDRSAEEVEKDLNVPFTPLDSKLFKAAVIICKDGRFFWFNIHHVLTDGGSIHMLMDDLYELYMDEAFVPVRDMYFHIAKKLQDAKKENGYREAEAYFKKAFSAPGSGRSIGLKPDFASTERNSVIIKLPNTFERKEIYDTVFFLTAAAIATARYNREGGAFVYSTFNGRHDRDTINCAGFLITQLVMGLDVKKDASPGELLHTMKENLQFAMNHLEYNYMNEVIGDASEMVRFIYQKDTVYVKDKFENLTTESINANVLDKMSGVLSINIIDVTGDDKLGLIVRYCPDVYKQESMERFIGLFKEAVAFLETSGDGVSVS